MEIYKPYLKISMVSVPAAPAALPLVNGLVNLAIPRLATLATLVAVAAPQVAVPLIVVGGTLAAYQAWHYFSQENHTAIKNLAISKYCAGGGASGGLCPYGAEVTWYSTNNYRGFSIVVSPTAEYDKYRVVQFQDYYDYQSRLNHKIEFHNRVTDIWQDLGTLDPSTLKETPIAGKKWEEWPYEFREQAIANLTPSDWTPIIQSMPRGGLLQPDQIVPAGVIVTGNPDSPYTSEQTPYLTTSPTTITNNSYVFPTASGSGYRVAAAPASMAPSASGGSMVIPVGIGAPTTTGSGTGSSVPAASAPSHVVLVTPGAASTPKIEVVPNPAYIAPAPVAAPADLSLNTLFDQLQDLKAGLALVPAAVGVTLAPSLIRSLDAPQVRAAAAAGTCDTAKPNGCIGSQLGDIKNNQNTLLQGLDQATQAGQGALLTAINNTMNLLNTKVGDVAAIGSLGSALNNVMNHSGVGRLMEMITMLGVIHNAMMLSNNLDDTLFQIIDNLIAVPSLIVNPKGETVNSQDVFGKAANDFFLGIFGAQTWAEIKASYKAFNTISSNAAQVWDNTRSIISDSQDIQNISAGWIAEIGNALRDDGLISDNNWKQKPDKPKFKSRALHKLEGIAKGVEAVDNALQSIEMVTSNLRNIVETGNQIKENVNEIDKAVEEGSKSAEDLRKKAIDNLPELPFLLGGDF